LDSVLADVQQQLARPRLEVFRVTSVEDVLSQLSRATIDGEVVQGRTVT
jgi:hypothetical protein